MSTALNAHRRVNGLEAADVIVLAVPKCNFSIPFHAQGVDRPCRARRSHLPLHRCGPEGLLKGKKVPSSPAAAASKAATARPKCSIFRSPFFEAYWDFSGLTMQRSSMSVLIQLKC